MRMLMLMAVTLWGGLAVAQEWQTVDQSWMNVTYRLPADWEIDGFGSASDNFDGYGSSVCQCAGSINFGPERKLGMVIYPYTSKSKLARRDSVWDYHFASVAATSTFKANKIVFDETVSAWERTNTEDNSGMLDDRVLRYATNLKGVRLIIYFWGDVEVVKVNDGIIKEILQSIRVVKG